MAVEVDKVIESVLSGYSQVEPRAGAVENWIARRAAAPVRDRFLWLPAPAWAAITFALLLLLGLTYYRPAWWGARQPKLANEHTTIQALAPDAPLTEEQKQLIHILLTDPSALATLNPQQLEKAEKPPAPKKPR